MTGTFDFTPHGPMKVMLPLMPGAVRRASKQMAPFAFCEARRDLTPSAGDRFLPASLADRPAVETRSRSTRRTPST
jgi:hypothetical protein